MDEIKVNLLAKKYPPFNIKSEIPTGAYHNYLVKYPPLGIRYVNAKKGGNSQVNIVRGARNSYYRSQKKLIRKFFSLIKIPNFTFSSKESDINHCANCLSLNRRPWVVDTEIYDQLSFSCNIRSGYAKMLTKKYLLKDSCRGILPWSESAKMTIFDALKSREIEKKTEVIYPAVPAPDFRKRKTDEINLLFAGRNFYGKGGLAALKSMCELTNKYDNVYAKIISSLPPNIRRKELSDNPRIEITDLISREMLFREIFPKTDIMIHPGYEDTFGIIMLEAMSFGIPVITVDGFARKEIVSDGETGYVIERPKDLNRRSIRTQKKIISDMVKRTSVLIRDENLRKRMGNSARKEVESGKFSIRKRNNKLRKIYENL